MMVTIFFSEVRGHAKNLLKRANERDRQAYIAANTTYANLRNGCRVTVNSTKTECSKCALQACKSDRLVDIYHPLLSLFFQYQAPASSSNS